MFIGVPWIDLAGGSYLPRRRLTASQFVAEGGLNCLTIDACYSLGLLGLFLTKTSLKENLSLLTVTWDDDTMPNGKAQ